MISYDFLQKTHQLRQEIAEWIPGQTENNGYSQPDRLSGFLTDQVGEFGEGDGELHKNKRVGLITPSSVFAQKQSLRRCWHP